MRFRNATSQALRRITRRYPWFRHLGLTTAVLLLIWLYTIYHGERTTFQSHVEACNWSKWEQWPHDAAPHHLVFVADPQLVDPHTYPGRPWPLSSLTEKYTDRYMKRSFRLINENLDPDSIVFLGDLFDGGREWAPSRAKAFKNSRRDESKDSGKSEEVEKEEQNKPPAFNWGENGRWAKWDERQWKSELERFGHIFFSRDQLYPNSEMDLLPAFSIATDPVSAENGAKVTTWEEYAVAGGKHRQVMASLPGNHDLGFGAGVQITVRDRFQAYFGDTNSIYVLGNHTFVSLDVPSLSASDEYVPEAGEVSPERRNENFPIWNPTNDYMDTLSLRVPSVVRKALNAYFPGTHLEPGYSHVVLDPTEAGSLPLRKHEPNQKPELPVILLSHVPLYRNPDTDCGKLRERGKAIPISRGYQYQNVLTPTLSDTIAKKVATIGDIEHIFSGDDHDYCDITHRFNIGRWDENGHKDKIALKSVREITVKSFSWAMGVRRPGFLLASLWNPIDEMGRTIGTPLPTIQTHLCLLPDQLSIFIKYATFLAWTLAVLFFRAVVVGWRNIPIEEDDESEDELSKLMSLPRFKARSDNSPNGSVSGYATPTGLSNSMTGRQRASSTSASTSRGDQNTLSVQRSLNARTRSISPAPAAAAAAPTLPNLYQHSGPLIEKAGYYPQMRWQDPDESDEESHIGEELQDSQAKWKKRRRPTRAKRALDEFLISMVCVAIPSSLFYGFIIKNG